MAVVAFLRDSQRDGVSEHMDSQNNRHKLHLLSESVGQPLYAFVYPSRVLPDTSRIATVTLSISTEVIFVNSCSACPKARCCSARCCIAAFSIPLHCQRKEFTKFCDHLGSRFPGSWYILPLGSFFWEKRLYYAGFQGSK